MNKISLVDVQVYPDYWRGIFAGNQYIHPQTLEEGYFNTFADEGMVEKWRRRVLEVRDDTRRLLVHVHGGANTSARSYLQEYVLFLRAQLADPRFIDIHHKQIDQLRDIVKGKALVIIPNAKVEAYGHHRGDCVPKEGKKVVDSLGLPADCFTEIKELSVGDMVPDRIELIKGVNPELYYYFSDEHLNELRARKDNKQAGLILDQRNYLFLYCTPESIIDAAQRAKSIQEFADLIGGNFATFNFIEDYFRLRALRTSK